MKIKTTKQIYEESFIRDSLFWIEETDDKEYICSMDNNPLNNIQWVRVSDELPMWEEMRVYVAQQQIRYGDNLHLREMYGFCNDRINELSQSNEVQK